VNMFFVKDFPHPREHVFMSKISHIHVNMFFFTIVTLALVFKTECSIFFNLNQIIEWSFPKQ